jgi:hypothetical protein
MRIGIGLPAAVPGADMTATGRWAAAACTSEVELISTVVNVCWRNNPTLLAKQLASVTRLSGGRLTAGLGMGGWPADYESSRVSLAGRALLQPRPGRRANRRRVHPPLLLAAAIEGAGDQRSAGS